MVIVLALDVALALVPAATTVLSSLARVRHEHTIPE
jgi:hypothetical protein